MSQCISLNNSLTEIAIMGGTKYSKNAESESSLTRKSGINFDNIMRRSLIIFIFKLIVLRQNELVSPAYSRATLQESRLSAHFRESRNGRTIEGHVDLNSWPERVERERDTYPHQHASEYQFD